MTPTLYQSLAREMGSWAPCSGRHVIRRAGERDAVVKFFAFNFGNQAKVKNDYAAFFRYQDVGRFDVAMKLSRFVQAVQALGKLPDGNRAND